MSTETQNRLNRHGNAFIEYFLLAIVVLLATFVFFDNGNYRGARGNIQAAFDRMVDAVISP
jgi:Flp pilus assembly protein TadG